VVEIDRAASGLDGEVRTAGGITDNLSFTNEWTL